MCVCESRSVMSNSLRPHPWNSLGQDTGVGSLSLLQGIFPTQGSKPGLPHCRRILYQLSDKRGWLFSLYINTVILLYTTLPLRFSYKKINILIISFQFSHVQLFATLWLQHSRPPCPSPTPRVYSNSYPLSRWCHPAISSSVVPFSSYLQSFPASGSFPMSQFFTSGSQNIGVSASASVLPMNIQDWFPLGSTGWILLQSKGLSRVFLKFILFKMQTLNKIQIYI